MQKKLLLILTSKKCKPFFQYLQSIRTNTSIAFQHPFHPFDNPDKITHIHKKHDTSLSIMLNKNKLTFTRTFDGELLDTFEYELIFTSGKYEIDHNPIHYTIMESFGENETNMFTDFFTCSSRKVALEGIKYVFVIKKTENGFVISYEDFNGKKQGPEIELKEMRKWKCKNELWERATEVETEKKIKNVAVNEMKDVIGTLHMEKQDLREIQIKKQRRVKNKE